MVAGSLAGRAVDHADGEIAGVMGKERRKCRSQSTLGSGAGETEGDAASARRCSGTASFGVTEGDGVVREPCRVDRLLWSWARAAETLAMTTIATAAASAATAVSRSRLSAALPLWYCAVRRGR